MVNFYEWKVLKPVMGDYSQMIKITTESTILATEEVEAMKTGNNHLRSTWLITRKGRHMDL